MSTIRTNNIVALDAEDATISTATISIKAIQVGKRQMTQSVFRQLPVAPLVDEVNVCLLGIPWGWVNYHWGDIHESFTQFIFQVGSRLHRNAFRIRTHERHADYDWAPIPVKGFHREFGNLVEAFHYARIVEGWRPVQSDRRSWNFRCHSNAIPSQAYVETFPANIGYLTSKEDNDYYARVRADVRTELLGNVEEAIGDVEPSEQIWERIRQLDRRATDFNRRWDALMQQLRGVEQLYIAC